MLLSPEFWLVKHSQDIFASCCSLQALPDLRSAECSLSHPGNFVLSPLWHLLYILFNMRSDAQPPLTCKLWEDRVCVSRIILVLTDSSKCIAQYLSKWNAELCLQWAKVLVLEKWNWRSVVINKSKNLYTLKNKIIHVFLI